jgi:TRAP-type C4-dicarboxylate transport system permease small subunit
MKTLDLLLKAIGTSVPVVLLAIVLLIVPASVITRNLFGAEIHAAHDIAILAFAGVVWFGLIGAAIDGQLFGVNFFVDRLPGRWPARCRIASSAIVILCCVAVIYSAWMQIGTSRFSRFLTLGWPKWIVSAALLASMALVIAVQLREIARLHRDGSDGKAAS